MHTHAVFEKLKGGGGLIVHTGNKKKSGTETGQQAGAGKVAAARIAADAPHTADGLHSGTLLACCPQHRQMMLLAFCLLSSLFLLLLIHRTRYTSLPRFAAAASNDIREFHSLFHHFTPPTEQASEEKRLPKCPFLHWCCCWLLLLLLQCLRPQPQRDHTCTRCVA